jgi:citrate lyase subunit beta/citryl-CoA lyase
MIFELEFLEHLEGLVERGEEGELFQLLERGPTPPPAEPIPNPRYRSGLIISGHKPKHLNKLDEVPADFIILNLEDGVPPQKKRVALLTIGIFLQRLPKIGKELVVRINPLSEQGRGEVEFLEQFPIHSYRLPKVEGVAEVEELLHLTSKRVDISVETAGAFFNLPSFRDLPIKLLFLGIYDLLNSLHLPHSLLQLENPLIHQILGRFTLESRGIGKVPIGFVYQKYRDLEGFRRWGLLQRQLGVEGVGVITPTQAQIANQLFTTDLTLAREIVEEFEKRGPFTRDGLYIDEPIYKNFKLLLGEG